MNEFKEAIANMKQAHMSVTYEYTYLVWIEFDSYNKTWDQWDALNLTWDQFEIYRE